MSTVVSNDAKVRQDVVDELAYDPLVTANDIAVVVKNGVVTLTGVADSYGTRTAAYIAAWRVTGVRDVVNEIAVDPVQLGRPTDAEIATDLRERLAKDFLVPKGRVAVSVHDGVVTLTGSVDWHLQREAAVEEAEGTRGVRNVMNLIAIHRGGPSPKDVDAEIRKALVRNAQLDASQIQVTANGGTVTLSGSVRSFAERQEAQGAAWRAAGTTEVINDIHIRAY